MSMPLVSIVSIFHNRKMYARDSVESLLAQTYPNLEIIVVDDGSDDGTSEVLLDALAGRAILKQQDNRGFTPTLKRAVESSRGKFIAIHGAGDISDPRRIELLAKVLAKRPDIALVNSFIEIEDVASGRLRVLRPERKGRMAEQLLVENPFSHGDVMFRRDAYDKAGGYRELFTFAQDRDLWLRMSRWTEFATVPEVLYRRRIVPGSVGASPSKFMMQARLSDFAVQCAQTRSPDGSDLVDRFGPAALRYRRRSRELALRLARRGLKTMVDEPEQGWPLVRAALEEHPSPSTCFAYAIGLLHIVPILWELVSRVAKAKRTLKARKSDGVETVAQERREPNNCPR